MRVTNHENDTADSIYSIDWEDMKDELRELMAQVMQINGGSRRRGTQACEVQSLAGEYFIWQTEWSGALDLMTLDKVKGIWGHYVTAGDHNV